MARARKATYSHRYRQPSLLNTLLFRLSSLNASEFPMPTSRRNILIRTVASAVGDITVGVACASVALWIIEAASLGLFLSFLIWLISALVALALSQYVVHPATKALLSDRKLDLAVDAVSSLGERLARFARFTAQPA